MPTPNDVRSKRQLISAGFGVLASWLVAGCDRMAEQTSFRKVLQSAEGLSQRAHALIASRKSMAQEFSEADLSPSFRGNGSTDPSDEQYLRFVKAGFTNWTLSVDGLVQQPTQFDLSQLRAMPSRTQITRHDCVEGWSAIGKWTGVPLSSLLAIVKPTEQAKFVVFHCADTYPGRGSSKRVPYYESVDLDDAFHIQTILAYSLNGAALPIANGAPLRLRVERQLGYKQAKYITRIELVDSLKNIGAGGGGFWEDRAGYQWYAGI